jgi:hypothetical protein
MSSIVGVVVNAVPFVNDCFILTESRATCIIYKVLFMKASFLRSLGAYEYGIGGYGIAPRAFHGNKNHDPNKSMSFFGKDHCTTSKKL